MNNIQKSVLVTGCSSGIGRSTIQVLASRGYQVFATARKPEDVESLQEAGFQCVYLDLTSESSIASAVEQVLSQTDGRLYALFNNGGFGVRGAVEDLSTQVLREQFETNFFGMHSLTKKVIPIMRSQGYGRIVQNSSLMGFVGMQYRGAYSASKFALEGLTDSLRQELKDSGIHVSLIQTGPVLSTSFKQNSIQSLERLIDVEDTVHNGMYRKLLAQQKSKKHMNFSVPAHVVASQVVHAIESAKPKVRYKVGFPVYFFGFIKRILPDAAFDYALSSLGPFIFFGDYKKPFSSRASNILDMPTSKESI